LKNQSQSWHLVLLSQDLLQGQSRYERSAFEVSAQYQCVAATKARKSQMGLAHRQGMNETLLDEKRQHFKPLVPTKHELLGNKTSVASVARKAAGILYSTAQPTDATE
jgi:hypothetical protein